jgi:DNA primase large subunit
MTPERFNKEFKYNIRHTYGLEGARTNYKPWDCARILLRPLPGKNEYHGCPYRDLSVDALTTQLGEMGVGAVDMKGVLNDVERKDYTVACTRVFEITHNVQAEHIGHPNLYFDRSRQLERAKTETA